MHKEIPNHLAAEPDLDTYSRKPVENFGMNLLKTMGFTLERGIGQNKKNALN